MKKTYQSPTLKVVEFKVERGFEISAQSTEIPHGRMNEAAEYTYIEYGENSFFE